MPLPHLPTGNSSRRRRNAFVRPLSVSPTAEDEEFERARLLGNTPPALAAILRSGRSLSDALEAGDATYEQLTALEGVRVTVPEATFTRLPVRRLGAGGAAAGVREAACLVCHEEFAGEERVVTLACSHSFHVHCARSWLRQYSNKCPVCKATVS